MNNIPARKTVYEYHIDLNERGYFYADVRNSRGRTIYEIRNDEDEDGSIWLIEAGYMKHIYDIDGLTEYLKDMGFMAKSAEMVLFK